MKKGFFLHIFVGNHERKNPLTLKASAAVVLSAALLGCVGCMSRQSAEPFAVEMVRIPGGTFMMGSDSVESEEKPVHQVTIGDFYMGKTEVTVGQWRRFVKETKYRTESEIKGGTHTWLPEGDVLIKGRDWREPGFPQGDDQPVTCVTWDDVQEFIEWINKKEQARYRLPTEAEWEYACRAGTAGPHYGEFDAIAWHKGNSERQTHPVAGKLPNAFGLYDMLGNVAEWCNDRFDATYYENSPAQNPKGPDQGFFRVHRGATWFNDAQETQAATRYGDLGSERNDLLGFRLARD